MSTILEADATGTLHLPPSLLPHPGPGRRYRVAAERGQVVVDEVVPAQHEASSREAWLKELERRRARGVAVGRDRIGLDGTNVTMDSVLVGTHTKLGREYHHGAVR